MSLQQTDEKKRGVLLVNLGTPKSPRAQDVFHYLNEFLTDPRVIDRSWLKRQFLVRGIIVPFRFRQSAEQYRRVWMKEEAPLLHYGKLVRNELQTSLGKNYEVVLAMRYQEPSIREGLEKLRKENVDELLILPLFPQYASATTGSVYQKVMENLKDWQIFPKLVFINSYCDHPEFVKAFCERALQYTLDEYDHVLFSFHGLPESQILKGNISGNCLSAHCCAQLCQKNRFCYKAQCYASARAIANELKIDAQNYTICFQSRLGKEPWLQPYLSNVIEESVQKGYKKILVFSPSFVCDCLETTYEIGSEYEREFKKMGGQSLQLVEGLNAHPVWIEALKTLVLENLSMNK